MFLARVVGNVWASVKWPELAGLKLLAVRPYHLSELSEEGEGVSHDLVVCADVLDAGVGDRVVVAYGHAARVALHEVLGEGEQPGFPIDAAVVAVVDRIDVDLASQGRSRSSSRASSPSR
jgi:ethanolamine utilization protein EutN